ncbi:MAG: glycosyltransferase family 1 protein [Lachnospiraceae bacterium]|nr:glycosyltransferase family 1 protein [Lachnospiraceae bacterium]
MLEKKVVVLQVIGEMVMGGAESRIMDLLRTLDPEKVHYDFLVFNPKEQHYDQEIEARGSHVYRLQPRFKMYNYFAFCKALKAFFMAHPEIDIVQGHMTSTAAIYLPIAKQCGVKCTIAHARSAGVDPGFKGLLTKWLRRDLYRRADVLFACSSEAAKAVYGEERYKAGKVRILPNAIDLSQFAPDEENRSAGRKVREKYGLGERFVVGHVGRFHYAKNHLFLLEIFRELLKSRKDAVLLLVGDGDTYAEVRERAAHLGIGDRVVFAGMQKDTAGYYHAMDLLIFPSRYEGLPGTVVEAQAAGVPCLMSSAVTKEVAVTSLVETLSLEEGASVWAEEALAHYRRSGECKKKEGFWQECYEHLCEKGFDVTAQARMLERIYRKMAVTVHTCI